MKLETKCIHEGYEPKNGEPMALPIYQSTTYRYDSTEQVGKLFDLAEAGHFYSRISNPTVAAVEKKIAALEGGLGALATSSGQAASMVAVLNLLQSGDHLISTAEIYGGTTNLFAVTMKKMGIEVTFVDAESSAADVAKAFRANTKAVFGETLANPALSVLDIEKWADIAHAHWVPLIVDNTFPTPCLCRPIEYGADIVTHSTTKYLDGHALQMGGMIVDSGNFDWTNGLFPEFTEPDESYHGVVYTRDFGREAYITKARVQMMRDIGAYQSANGAFLINIGLETLPLRMRRHSENGLAAAEFLRGSEKIERISYPGLEGDKYYQRAQKYLPDGCAGVISFDVKGGKQAAAKFIDSLELATLAVHVAATKTCVLHPATSTHRQLSDEQLLAAGISPGTVRLSVGIENIDDIVADLEQALARV